jgi:glycosyltransferase involved in cell wall biosynthesis
MKSTSKEVFETYKKRFTYFPEYEFVPAPDTDLKYAIVIPCYNEPELLITLNSLLACDEPTELFEVLVVVNNSIEAETKIKNANLETINAFNEWNKNIDSKLKFYCIEALELPSKKAGVGLARKIGMDIANSRFASMDKTGWIINLDADCEVSTNYLSEIESNVIGDIRGGHFYFEHKLDLIKDPDLKLGITLYELHLRYYAQALRYSGFKYWHHTVGSCMVTRSDVYTLQGGMNQRKAGEDFYFMHKIMPGGRIITLNKTAVYPSARISDRVPFGTGKAQGDWLEENNEIRMTYHFDLFSSLKLFFSTLEEWFAKKPNLNVELDSFLESIKFEDSVARIKKRSTSQIVFKNNLTHFCDGFFTLKLVHFLRDTKFGEGNVVSESNKLLSKLNGSSENLNALELLHTFREIDRKSE